MYEITNQQLQRAKLLCFIIDNNEIRDHFDVSLHKYFANISEIIENYSKEKQPN